MAAYAALAVGLINLRYQTGAENNLVKSALIFTPGILLILISLNSAGKKWLETKMALSLVLAAGAMLLLYSFIL